MIVNRHFELEEMIRALRDAVLTQAPGFRYRESGDKSGCYYVPSGEVLTTYDEQLGAGYLSEIFKSQLATIDPDSPPAKTGCLIGTALKILGLDPIQYSIPGGIGETVAPHLRNHYGVTFSENGLIAYQFAQNQQDSSGTWTHAFLDALQLGIPMGQLSEMHPDSYNLPLEYS